MINDVNYEKNEKNIFSQKSKRNIHCPHGEMVIIHHECIYVTIKSERNYNKKFFHFFHKHFYTFYDVKSIIYEQ